MQVPLNHPLWKASSWRGETTKHLPDTLDRWFSLDIVERIRFEMHVEQSTSIQTQIASYRGAIILGQEAQSVRPLDKAMQDQLSWHGKYTLLALQRATIEIDGRYTRPWDTGTMLLYEGSRGSESGRSRETWLCDRLRYLARLWNLTEDRQWWIMDCLLNFPDELPLECPPGARLDAERSTLYREYASWARRVS